MISPTDKLALAQLRACRTLSSWHLQGRYGKAVDDHIALFGKLPPAYGYDRGGYSQ